MRKIPTSDRRIDPLRGGRKGTRIVREGNGMNRSGNGELVVNDRRAFELRGISLRDETRREREECCYQSGQKNAYLFKTVISLGCC